MGFFKESELGGPRINDLSKKWQTDLNANGAQVEDFITRRLVNSMTYDGSTNILSLWNGNVDDQGNPNPELISEVEVSVAQPDYSHTIAIEKIFIDNVDVTNKPTIQCQLGSKIELGVRYNLIASNPLTGSSNHVAGKQNLSIKIGNGGYVKLEQGIQSSDSLQKLDITSLITNTTVSTISLRVVTYTGVPEELKIVAATSKEIAVLDPKIRYIGNNYIINGIASFQVQDGGTGIGYALRYVLNGGTLTRSNSFNVDINEPGVNTLEVYAVVSNEESIRSESITVQVINIKGQDTFDTLQCAINEISPEVVNWEYSKMYRVSLYTKGYTEESITINTQLTNTADDSDYYFNKTKTLETELINSKETDPYIYQEDICYFFGMNELTQNITAGLIVNINGKNVIAFEDYIQMDINSETTFTYTEGANFYFDQFDPDNSNIFTKEVLANIESPDGIVQEDSLTVFRVSANDYETPVVKQDLSSALTNAGFTFELDFKSYNISDPNKAVLKLGKFVLFPTEVNWQFTGNEGDDVDTTSRSALFQEDERTHIVIQVVPGFKAPAREVPVQVQAIANKTINLVRVFINGVVDREFKYDTLSDFNLNGFNLEIAPEASDIDIYDLRIYNRALSLEEISNNYISTMSNIEEKKFFQKANAIVKTDANNDTYISYNLAKELYNTLVFVIPKGSQYIHQFSATKDTKVRDCTVFVNYVNNEKLPIQLTEAQIAKSSGRFTGVELKGQGTSAMKYYWYNTSMKGKFTSHGCYDQVEQVYTQPEEGSDLLYNSKYYYMPTDPNTGIKKIVGKTNYASSMQSHKLGATKAFHDLWESCVDKSTFSEVELMGRRAVLEDPFLAFYIESDIESTYNKDSNPDAEGSPMKEITPEYLESLDDTLIKFAGFQTWGSGKGDDATSGYDEDLTPGYLMLEGAENDGKLANFLTPWMPDCIELSGETYKTLGLIVDDQNNISYGTFDSLDVDFGLAEDSETELCEAAKKTMERFIEAYNFVYMHTINLEAYTGTISLNDSSNKGVLDVTKKYYITNAKYSDPTGFSADQWDVFRYDQYSTMWVPAGLPVMDDNGKQVKHSTVKSPYGSDVFDYNKFNLKTFFRNNGGTGAESFANFRQLIIDKFKEGFGQYFHVNDVVFHQAFIKLFAGTDNRAKNTYFKLVNENSKISLLADDLDTILATDNRGLQKKPYFLLEPSQESDPEYKGMWGGNSALFEVFDIAYKEDIDQMLKSMLTQFEVNQEPSIHDWMQKYFYFVQEYFPATAYNHTARLCYECAQIFFDNQGQVGITWQNNGQDPVSQVHGSCLQSEKEFMKKRLIMFLSQAQISNIFGKEGMGINIKASEDAGSTAVGSYTIDITPYQYIYLGYNSGSNPNLYSKNRQAAEVPFTATITIDSTTPLYSVLGARYIKKFEDFSKIHWKSGTYNLSAKRLVGMSANPKGGELKFLPPMINLETPVLTKLDLTGVSSLTTINLDADHTPKLQEVYLTGTNITNVNLPTGSRLKTVHFPAALQNLYIYNNPGLVDVQFENYNNLRSVYIDCAKCGEFDVSAFLENIGRLESITLRNANLYITENALENIISAQNFDIKGKITIVSEAGGSVADHAISFETKKRLVEILGNIDSEDNDVTVYYKTEPIQAISANTEVYLYIPAGHTTYVHPASVFGLSVASGNDVETTSDGKLNITYEMSTIRNVASIDSEGRITQLAESDQTATVIIKMKVANRPTALATSAITVHFQWVAPEIGNFAYADGSFSNAYDSSKTVVGLVYAKDEISSTEGDVYIIGAEYASETPLYLGYEPMEGNTSSSDSILKEAGYLKTYAQSLGLDDYYATPENMSEVTHDTTTPIIYNSYQDTNNTTFVGAIETKAYYDHVNNNLLPILMRSNASTFGKYINTDTSGASNIYRINSLENLINLGKLLRSTGVTNMGSALLFPYFYSMYIYQPTTKSGESLDSQYEQGNWYAPSISELNRILYYRGLSALGSAFSSVNSVRANISKSINTISSKGILGIPIFSLAAKRWQAYPKVWDLINRSSNDTSTDGEQSTYGGVDNITTTMDASEADNFSYVSYYNYSGEYGITTKWMVGQYYDSNNAYMQPNGRNASRLTTHQGIPFVTYHYKKEG